MKKCSVFVLGCLLFVSTGFACTTFFLERNGQRVFGRNYDWVTSTGMVNTNQRGIAKSSLPLEKGRQLQWTSLYGSITFNQYGKEFPNGGMNEKGLVVELMWLSESRYPVPDNRPALSVLQWIQYQLDNCSTVNEVIATDSKLRVADNGAPQHYLVADANGKVATIEFLDGKMVVHSGDALPYPVLANSTYEESARALKNAAATNGSSPKTFNDNSIERFATACNMVQKYKTTNVNKPVVDYSFDILKNVAQGDFTKWSIVYDITNKKVFFKTADSKALKSFAFNEFDFNCTTKAVAFNMNENRGGDVSKNFTSFSSETNERMLKQAFKQSEAQIKVDELLQQAIANAAASFTCR